MEKIIILDDRYHTYDTEKDILNELDAEIIISPSKDKEEIKKLTENADGVLVNLQSLTESIIGNMKQCKIIARYGVGYDNVNIEAATKKGIWVANVPDYCVEDVRNHVLALLFNLTRQINRVDRKLRGGNWDFDAKITRTKGKTMGIIGFGHTGQEIFKNTSALELGHIWVYENNPDEEDKKLLNPQFTDLDTLLTESDYITIHIPLTEETKHLIGAKEIAKMKPGAFIINTSRGGIIDQKALTKALENKTIGGAGLDVFETEPISITDPLLKLPNVILTPHMAYYSRESILELKTKAAQNVLKVLKGEPPQYPVNKI